MADYKPGSMDIRQQERTFHGFIRVATWAAGLIVLTLIIVALADH